MPQSGGQRRWRRRLHRFIDFRKKRCEAGFAHGRERPGTAARLRVICAILCVRSARENAAGVPVVNRSRLSRVAGDERFFHIRRRGMALCRSSIVSARTMWLSQCATWTPRPPDGSAWVLLFSPRHAFAANGHRQLHDRCRGRGFRPRLPRSSGLHREDDLELLGIVAATIRTSPLGTF